MKKVARLIRGVQNKEILPAKVIKLCILLYIHYPLFITLFITHNRLRILTYYMYTYIMPPGTQRQKTSTVTKRHQSKSNALMKTYICFIASLPMLLVELDMYLF